MSQPQLPENFSYQDSKMVEKRWHFLYEAYGSVQTGLVWSEGRELQIGLEASTPFGSVMIWTLKLGTSGTWNGMTAVGRIVGRVADGGDNFNVDIYFA